VAGNFAEFVLTGQVLEGQTIGPGSLEIHVPSQVALADDLQCQPLACIKISSMEVTVALQEQILGPQTVTIRLQNLRNPYSTQSTDSF
jgi:hypothetical protein